MLSDVAPVRGLVMVAMAVMVSQSRCHYQTLPATFCDLPSRLLSRIEEEEVVLLYHKGQQSNRR